MIKKILLLILIVFYSTNSFSETINTITVVGNNRVSEETIINFSNLTKGINVDDNQLNESLKELYKTEFFENVDLSIAEGILTINVKEFPLVQEIKINGIKAKGQKEALLDNIFLKEKNPFNKNKLSKDLNTMLNIFKTSGFYFVKIEPSIEQNLNNTVNIIFDIDRGERATIKQIKFIGNKFFKDRKLFGVITSEEDKFWKVLSKQKYLDIERVKLDKRLLKSFYLEKGFYDIQIKDAYSKLIDNDSFILTYNIEAGKKYFFGKFKLDLPVDYNPNDFEKLTNKFSKLENKKYNLNEIEKILNEIEQIALIENYEFISTNIVENVSGNKIDFLFEFVETEKLYVDRINILGNNVTSEKFIRDNFLVDEGDPFNEILHLKSLNKLRATNLFKSVNANVSKNNDNFNTIELNIEEKPTGEIFAAAGHGSDGTTFSIGVNENNYKGEGIKLSSNLEVGKGSVKGGLALTTPNFAYSDRSLSTSVESSSIDKLNDSGYKSSLKSFSVGTSYEQFSELYFSPNISISDETIKTDGSASESYKKQAGNYFDTLFGYRLSYDKRNSPYQPTSGFVSSFSQNLPLVSKEGTIINSYSLTNYNELADNMIVTAGFLVKSATSIKDKDVRVSKRLYIPSSRLRGFKSGKVGPIDGLDYIGGNYISTLNLSSTVPFLLQTSEFLDLKLFLDAANVWGVDYSSAIDDSNKIRTSTGVALEVLTPVGPMSFSYAEAISKASTDQTESFRFQLGTTF
jgi:outer membrane protein insertion porin family